MKKRLLTIALAAVSAASMAGGNSQPNAWSLVPQLTQNVDSYLSARNQLIAMNVKAVPALMNGMSSRDEFVRSGCAWVLAKLGPAAYQPLSVALKTPQWRVRSSACLALGAMAPSLRRNQLLAQAVHDNHWWVRSIAVAQLKGAKDTYSTVALRNAMDDPDPRVRSRANEAYQGTITASNRNP